MESKITPGPWTCKPISSRVTNNNRSFEIRGFETERSIRDVLESEIEPNAKAIAALPELIEGLQKIFAICSKREMPTETEVAEMEMLAALSLAKALD